MCHGATPLSPSPSASSIPCNLISKWIVCRREEIKRDQKKASTLEDGVNYVRARTHARIYWETMHFSKLSVENVASGMVSRLPTRDRPESQEGEERARFPPHMDSPLPRSFARSYPTFRWTSSGSEINGGRQSRRKEDGWMEESRLSKNIKLTSTNRLE